MSAKPKAVYRAGTIKRSRRTKEQIDQLDRQIIAVLREDKTMSKGQRNE
ncbi:MAG: hypothetical protein WD078_08810 [Woeseia sp.]